MQLSAKNSRFIRYVDNLWLTISFYNSISCSVLYSAAGVVIMATVTEIQTDSLKKRRLPASKLAKLPPESERYVRACADIANYLVEDYEKSQQPGATKKDVNLNTLRGCAPGKIDPAQGLNAVVMDPAGNQVANWVDYSDCDPNPTERLHRHHTRAEASVLKERSKLVKKQAEAQGQATPGIRHVVQHGHGQVEDKLGHARNACRVDRGIHRLARAHIARDERPGGIQHAMLDAETDQEHHDQGAQ